MFISSDIRPIIDWSNSGGGAAGITVTSFFPPITISVINPYVPSVFLLGTDGDDLLEGGANDDRLVGRGGDDTLLGHQGYDTLLGGAGNDVLRAGDHDSDLYFMLPPPNPSPVEPVPDGQSPLPDHNLLRGGLGNDELFGSSVMDVLKGGRGDDFILTGDSLDDIAMGGRGNDTIIGTGDLRGNAGDDRIEATGHAIVKGGTGNDTLVAAHAVTLYGGRGADDFVFDDKSGTATIHRLGKHDRLVIEGSHITKDAIRYDLGSGPQNDPLGIRVTLENGHSFGFDITHGLGQSLFDVTYEGDNTVLVRTERIAIDGDPGAEVLTGTAENEIIDGKGGADTFTGGDGLDVFVAQDDSDPLTITDFTYNEDRIDVSSWGAASLDDLIISYVTKSQAVIEGHEGQLVSINALDEQYELGFVSRDFLFDLG